MNSDPQTLTRVLKSFTQTNLYRAHHSKHPDLTNSKHGNAILVWDHLFGSYRSAQTSSTLVEVGLFESSQAYPATRSYWQQVRLMLSPACLL
jgi:ornithine lipid hydroxylase